MKEYTIAAVAKILGVTPSGVKFFERYGVIPCQKAENKYRYYTILDIQTMFSMREYCNCGFSLAQAAALTQCDDEETALGMLAAQREKLRDQARLQLRIADKMEEIERRLASFSAQSGALVEVQSPVLFATVYSRNSRDAEIMPQDYERLSRWIELMPLTDVFSTADNADFPKGCAGRHLGFCIDARDAGFLAPAELSTAVRLPARKCLYTIFEASATEHEIGWYIQEKVYRPMTKMARAPIAPPFGRTVRMFDGMGKRRYYFEIWTPVA